jgi:hypothetical protein
VCSWRRINFSTGSSIEGVDPVNVLAANPMSASGQSELSRSVVAHPFRLKGFLWSIAVPTGWLALAYGFVLHVWLSLGRWPDSGEHLSAWPLLLHYKAAKWMALGMFYSLYLVLVVLPVCLCFRRWRHVSLYLICYGLAVGVSLPAVMLAPSAILSWVFD